MDNVASVNHCLHGDSVTCVAWKPSDGAWLATGCSDKLARIFDVETGSELQRLRHESHVSSVAWCPVCVVEDAPPALEAPAPVPPVGAPDGAEASVPVADAVNTDKVVL